MASYEIDQRGGHYDDLRAGMIASTFANAHRDSKMRPTPFGPLDFVGWSECHRDSEAAEPILLDDPEEQSKMLDRMLFPSRHG